MFYLRLSQFSRVNDRLLISLRSHVRAFSSPISSGKAGVPEKADTVIIGGGAVGVSIAYHLARDGKGSGNRVVLLERTQLTSGSTWHAAGLTTFYHGGINMKKLHYESIKMYQEMAASGEDIGWHPCGSLRLATSKERLNEFYYHMSRTHWHDTPQHLLTIDEIQKVHPLLNMDGIVGGLYNPADGYVDPYSLTMAIAARARKEGASIVQDCMVTSMKEIDDGWKIETNSGSLVAKRIINAAGFWAREVGFFSDVNLPLIPVHHQYVVTRSLPEVQALEKETPVIRDLDGSYYMRQERGGLLYGPYEGVAHMRLCEDWYDVGPPPDFGKELFEPDMDRISIESEAAMHRFPILENAEIQTVVAGPITYTPDVLPLVGPHADRRNLWIAAGFGYGIVHAGGVGKYISDWILNGEPSYDLVELDPSRFSPWINRKYTVEKAREGYGMNNAVTFPKEERTGGRPAPRLSPLYEAQKECGAQFTVSAGWETPKWFSLAGDDDSYSPSFKRTNWYMPVRREMQSVRERVGLIDLTSFGKISISGTDASRFIAHVYANEVPKVGRTVISHMLAKSGKVFAEHTITRLPDCESGTYLCITGGSAEQHDLSWMQDQAKLEGLKVNISSVTDNYCVIGVAGPNSRDLLQQMTKTNMSRSAFPFMTAQTIALAGVPCLAMRVSYTGELGWELYTSMDRGRELYLKLKNHGHNLGVMDFGGYAMDGLRIEVGFRAWGREMNMDSDPLTAGLGMFIKTKRESNFIGKEAILALKEKGLTHKIVAIEVDTNDVDPEGNETLWLDGKVAGYTTSGCRGHTVNKSLALAKLPVNLAIPDTNGLTVELLNEKRDVRVLSKAPVEFNSKS